MKKRYLLLIIFTGIITSAGSLHHPVNAAELPPPRRIEVTAQRFSFAPAEITLKKGEPVTLVLKSADVAHGLRFRALNIDIRVNKGATTQATFTPESVGDFVGQCSVFCGVGHGSMKLTLHVVE